MAELMAVREAIPSLIQTLGLIAPAIACCYVQLSRRAASNYMVMGKGSDYYKTTGNNVRALTEQKLMAHDHAIKELTPDTKNRKSQRRQLVVEIPKGDVIDYILVNRGEGEDRLEVTQELKPGDPIPGTSFIHNHQGTENIGPWEYNPPEEQKPTS